MGYSGARTVNFFLILREQEEKKTKYFAPKKAVGEMIPVFLATNMVIPVSKKGTEKSMTDWRPELIFIDVNTMSVSWFINSATSPFHFPLTMPPHLPSRTLYGKLKSV